MGSTSNQPVTAPNSACGELLEYCLRGESWTQALLDRALAVDEGRAFLSIVVERLGDLFEPRLTEVYERLFSEVILRVAPELKARIRSLSDRQKAIHAAPASANRVFILSRVTLGADVAVTSVLIDAAKHRYPAAEIIFVGPKKSFELFEADPRVRHSPAPYARSGALRDRLTSSAALWLDDGIVIDPDSRLTQLGLLSVCHEQTYFLFPSRSYQYAGVERLPELAACWAEDVFGVTQANAFVAPVTSPDEPADITVSLGVGGNESKRITGDFERDLLQLLARTGKSVLVDKGGDIAERDRVESALVPGMRTHDGAFAVFASLIQQSRLFVGYDSAGGHVASACGVPVISIAKGFVSERMAARWQPNGTVIDGTASHVLDQIQKALSLLTPDS